MLLLAAIVGVAAFLFLWRAFGAANRSQRFKQLAVGAAVVLVTVLLLLTATGRLHWLAALAAGALPFLRGLAGLIAGPLISNFLRNKLFARGTAPPGADPGPAPKDSTVATNELRMTLDHETGAMDGEILAGGAAGRRLSELDLHALETVFGELSDQDSRQLLGAYLDRRFPGWSEAADHRGRTSADTSDEMDAEQALAVLGLDAGASKTDIVEAHRRLMQKLHPDRGGTDYLAATLNRAKKVLINGD
ncbi:MAG: molecular chaperone DnaJ [Gammaproteobacteria bacterium]|nr:molecular chaperone DnaJ [Gammaproteobacteria bacterium]